MTLLLPVALDELLELLDRIPLRLLNHKHFSVVPNDRDTGRAFELLVEVRERSQVSAIGGPGRWHEAEHDEQAVVPHDADDRLALWVESSKFDRLLDLVHFATWCRVRIRGSRDAVLGLCWRRGRG